MAVPVQAIIRGSSRTHGIASTIALDLQFLITHPQKCGVLIYRPSSDLALSVSVHVTHGEMRQHPLENNLVITQLSHLIPIG